MHSVIGTWRFTKCYWREILTMSTMDLLGVVGFVVGVIGTFFGWKQYRDMKKAEGCLREITGRLESSEEREISLTNALNAANEKLTTIHEKSVTIAVARFPFNLNSLVELMDACKSELAIICDFIGYAMYSNPSGFGNYFESLRRAVERGVKVRLLLYGLDTGRQAIGKQLPPGRYLEDRESPLCSDYFQQWHPGSVCPSSYNEFRDTLLKDEEELMAKLHGVELKVTDHSLLTFVWISDQTEACVFSFRNDGNDEAGMTFRSRDEQIATNFRAVFDSEWGRASAPLYKGRW
jgi:hypothetical protein